MLFDLFIPKKKSNLRRLIRGFYWCRSNNGFAAIRKLKNGLVDIVVESSPENANFFFGSSAPNAEAVIRQCIYMLLGTGRLNNSLFESFATNKSIAVVAPSAWRKYLVSNGLQINELKSSILWQIYVWARVLRGVVFWHQLCLKLAFARVPKSIPLQPYGYLLHLSQSNLPTGDLESYDICTFYARCSERNQSVYSIRHDVKGVKSAVAETLPVGYLPHPYELPCGFKSSLRLTGWGIRAIIYALFQLLLGKSSLALLLAEATKAKAVSLCHPKQLAVDYWFHFSGLVYRPMWTYEAEKLGAKISTYFYSTYTQPTLAAGYETYHYHLGPVNWPCYLVWNQYQEDMMRRELGDKVKISQVGPIYFSDSYKTLPDLPNNTIAVFDIQPQRLSAFLPITTFADCLASHPDFFHRFLIDVSEVIRELGGFTALKLKRNISRLGLRSYEGILNRLSTDESVYMIDPSIAALRVSACCRATISVPFTSTAIIASTIGKPSIFYDPYGWTQPGDISAHGIQVICGKSELVSWLGSILNLDV